jgi:hypothetical protein
MIKMIYYKKLTKLSPYALYFIQKFAEINLQLLEKWLDKRSFINCEHPIGIDSSLYTEIDRTIINEADNILHGQYRLFGRLFDMGAKISWDKDFVSGFNWPKGTFFKYYQQVDLNNSADVKYPRELSRFHHALALGQAYQITGNPEYYKCFKANVLDWIDENPYMRSINWGCTQDVAIRAVNWLWGITFFQNALAKDLGFKQKLDRNLYKHGFYIYLYPEKGNYNNHNHYLSDLVGQIYIGIYFKDDKYAKNWLNWGIEELYREIRYQILPSGPSYERSINYNRFVTEMLFSAIILLRNNGYLVPQDIMYRMEKMLEFVMHYIKPDGFAPNIGDQDDARLHPFGLENNLDHRYLLSLGAVIWGRGDFKFWSKGYHVESAIQLGTESERIYNQIKTIETPLKSEAYPDAGFYIIRDESNYMFINNSGKSKYNELGGGTHTHSDLLSFELCMGDKTFLIDPGSYKYSGDPDMRMHFRSTKMHNTLSIDKQNQHTLNRLTLWDFPNDAIPQTTLWSDN